MQGTNSNSIMVIGVERGDRIIVVMQEPTIPLVSRSDKDVDFARIFNSKYGKKFQNWSVARCAGCKSISRSLHS